MGEITNNQSKEMLAVEFQSTRELTDYANEFNITRGDIVTILPSKEGYVMVYYY